MTNDRVPESAARRILVRPLARLAVIAGLTAVLNGCGGGGGGFSELLFVSDNIAVTSYSLSGTTPTMRGFAMIPGIPGTYSRAGTLVTITMQKHNVFDGYRVLLDFSAGIGGTATDGVYVPTVIDENTFTVVDSAAGIITGGTVLRSPSVQLGATYSQAGTTVTITLAGHGLAVEDSVILDYTTGTALDDDTLVVSVPDADTFTVTADAAATTSGNVNVIVGGNYTILGMAMHPSGRWLYASSAYDCFNGHPYCWAGDLITQFAIDWGSGHLAFVASYRTTDDPVAVTETPSPVTLAFSADGTRLFHQDDELDGLRMWGVDPTDGSLTLLAATDPDTTNQHGLAVSADGTRLYHGSRVFTVGPASLTAIPGGSGGEANQIVGGTTMFALIGGGGNPQLRAFSLADPDLPLQIAASPNTPNQARDFALFNNGALIVESGFGGLKSYTFSGATIMPAVGVGDTELRDGGLPFPLPDTLARVYRTISGNAAGNLVASAYFTNDPAAGTGGIPPSGFILANVAADGSLSLAGDFQVGTYARVARFFQKP